VCVSSTEELPVAKLYRIKEAAAPFYLLFFCCVVAAWSVTDIFTLNVQGTINCFALYCRVVVDVWCVVSQFSS